MKKTINGNIEGIKNTLLARIEQLYDFPVHQSEFVTEEVLNELAALTVLIRREISLYIARNGSIADVSIGEGAKVSMPAMRLVRNEDRLCGVRCIHTHPNGDGRLSGVDIGTLLSMRLDSMAALGVGEDGRAVNFYAGFVGDVDEGGERKALIAGPLRPQKLPHKLLLDEIRYADERLRASTKVVDEGAPESAILVGLENSEGYDTLAELEELAKTAGAKVITRFTQKRRALDNATYVGSGKLEELSLAASETDADIFIFDDELTPMQHRNLEAALNTRVIDRTALILDIFAQRAKSREGKLQVELAQLKYGMTRLIGSGLALSQQGAGIGTRGPGEKKLEIDRRRVKRRIFELSEELADVEKQRALRRVRREKSATPLVALVGYTNAGKSTLLNAMSDANVNAEDKLFATLDPVVRQVELPGGTQVLFSDTVGFINKLPHEIVEAFKSTLEDVADADLILHVVDSASPYYERQMQVVEDVLGSLGAADTPKINVFNKIDMLDSLPTGHEGDAFIAAVNGQCVGELLNMVEQKLNSARFTTEITIPYDRFDAVALIRAEGRIISEEYAEEGTHIVAQLDEGALWKLKRMLNAES